MLDNGTGQIVCEISTYKSKKIMVVKCCRVNNEFIGERFLLLEKYCKSKCSKCFVMVNAGNKKVLIRTSKMRCIDSTQNVQIVKFQSELGQKTVFYKCFIKNSSV